MRFYLFDLVNLPAVYELLDLQSQTFILII